MNTAVHSHPASKGMLENMFTEPTSSAFQRWVAIINFAIFISCLSLAGETVEPYATEHASLFKAIEYLAVLFFTIDYLGNLYYAKNRVKYFFSFWGLVDLVSILPTYLMIMNLTALQGTKVFRILRVVRVLRVLKMARIALQELEKKLESSNPILTNLKIYFIALFSVVMISSNVPFRDLITPTLIVQKLEEYDFGGATVIGAVMLIFSLISLLVINLIQVWGQRYQGGESSA